MIQMGKLTRLFNFTDGEVKGLIKHCIHLPTETGYETAARQLNNRHENPLYLLASCRKEIMKVLQLCVKARDIF